MHIKIFQINWHSLPLWRRQNHVCARLVPTQTFVEDACWEPSLPRGPCRSLAHQVAWGCILSQKNLLLIKDLRKTAGSVTSAQMAFQETWWGLRPTVIPRDLSARRGLGWPDPNMSGGKGPETRGRQRPYPSWNHPGTRQPSALPALVSVRGCLLQLVTKEWGGFYSLNVMEISVSVPYLFLEFNNQIN